MRSTTWTTRRESRMLLLAMAFLMVIAALVVLPAAPASAHHPVVSGSAVCDARTGGWTVTWTITDPTESWSAVKTMGVEKVETTSTGSFSDLVTYSPRVLVDGLGLDFATNPVGVAATSFVVTQHLVPGDGLSVGDVLIAWATSSWHAATGDWHSQDTKSGQVTLPERCVASLTLLKSVSGGDADPGSWTLIATGPDPSSATVISGPSGSSATDLIAGTYSLSETGDVANYVNGGSWVCEGAEDSSSQTVTLEVGDEATCTITNTYREPEPDSATLTIVKDTIGANGTFDFVLTKSGETPSVIPITTTAYTGSWGPNEVSSGEYTLGEVLGEGWVFDGVECSNDGQVLKVPQSYPVSLTIDEGDDISCTFTNRKLAKITVVKEANAAGSFDFTLWGDQYEEDEVEIGSATVVTGGSYTWYLDGSSVYGISEDQLPAYWTLADVDCSGENWEGNADLQGAWFWVGHGGEVTCTFTNHYDPPRTITTVPTALPVLDLQIDKTGVVTADITEVDGVATIRWTLVVSHGAGSNVNAVGATISDAAPAGMTFTSVTSADMTCAIVDNAVACGPFNLAVGGTATAVVTATAASAGTFENIASVTAQGDSVESNNTDDAEVSISQVLPLEILPETGLDSDGLAWFAGLLLLMGGALILGTRRGESFNAGDLTP